jgi:hypothetical protein
MNMLRNGLVFCFGVITCVVAWGAPPPVLATVRNTQLTAAVAVGGQPPALAPGKPRFPIVPAGVPIKSTPITRTTTNSKGVPQQVVNAQAPANAQVVGKSVAKTPAANTPASSQPITAPASPVVAPGSAPAASGNVPAAPATPSSGNGGSAGGNAGSNNSGSGSGATPPAPAASASSGS